METIGERIKKVRQESSLTTYSFAERIGVKPPSVSRWETGINNPSLRTLKIICSEFGINEDWLLNGSGEMHTTVQELSSYSEQDQDFITQYLSLPSDQKDWLRNLMDRLVVANKAERE